VFGKFRKVVDDLHTQAIVDDLTFAAYKNNRLRRPDITPESWAKIFGTEKGAALERRFLKWWIGQHPSQPEGPQSKH
jgi:hypothetical protein